MKKVIGCFMYMLLTIYVLITIGLLYTVATGPHSENFLLVLFNCLTFNAVCYFIARWLIKQKNKK